ncbi:MAG: hypothetical protein KDJ38_10635 [Gammaproteobacteria bacterium]|nr:hypothetical protein [Gammaproteobacteria bacterium]
MNAVAITRASLMVNKIKLQVALPSPATGMLELLIFCSVFLLTGTIGLNSGVSSMILPMLVFSAIMMSSMIVTGVYRPDIAHSIMRLYQRTALGCLIAGAGFAILATLSSSACFDIRFSGLVLLFSYFVVSTIRPVIVDTVSTSEGDRRAP